MTENTHTQTHTEKFMHDGEWITLIVYDLYSISDELDGNDDFGFG